MAEGSLYSYLALAHSPFDSQFLLFRFLDGFLCARTWFLLILLSIHSSTEMPSPPIMSSSPSLLSRILIQTSQQKLYQSITVLSATSHSTSHSLFGNFRTQQYVSFSAVSGDNLVFSNHDPQLSENFFLKLLSGHFQQMPSLYDESLFNVYNLPHSHSLLLKLKRRLSIRK